MEGKKSISDDLTLYNEHVEKMRLTEYPMLKDAIYLDHAGTTLYSKSQMDRFHADMISNIYGNPHSASPSSQRSTLEVESVRLRLLQFFNADPDHFDLVFTANATAGIKLVGDAFREQANGFSFGYHIDSHTSVVGVRELAQDHVCLVSKEDVENWTSCPSINGRSKLFAYPAQSNMNGHRPPLDWSRRATELGSTLNIYTLLDVAAYVSTSPLDFSDVDRAPDLTVMSLNKIFGFPDLGALIVKKSASHVLSSRKYFGGGTVDMVVCLKEQWHAKKSGPLHEQLEDGTLPVHSILALRSAMQTHTELFGTLEQVSRHSARLAQQLYEGLLSLHHANGKRVCTIYKHPNSCYGNVRSQGPIIALNLRDSNGNWVSNAEVEKLASIRNIHLRTGGVCNPGGVATALDLAPWEMHENFSAGHRCGSENDILNGKPTGVIRLSLGATSTRSDVDRFLDFVDEFFVDKTIQLPGTVSPVVDSGQHRFHVESITVYPIKSCGGFQIPNDVSWEVRPEGLAWDREWCIVHQGTGKALSQKQYPRMALLRPILDFKSGTLRISMVCSNDEIAVPLAKNPQMYAQTLQDHSVNVCGDTIETYMYKSTAIAEFLTRALGMPCTLARFSSTATRHSKPHLQPLKQTRGPEVTRPILMSNESPILTISRSSLNRLNEDIKARGGKAAHPSVFRANIILAENPILRTGEGQPWAEDHWQGMRVGGTSGLMFDFLGGCRRCQMVCVDQENAEKNGEPFVTLAKTRRYQGRVLFGVHTALSSTSGRGLSIKANDVVETFSSDE